jgi:nucleotide-binding universal stress UspA family protein
MTFTSLLVHVEAAPPADARLALAVDLANQFNAKLIGIGAELYRAPIVGYDGYSGAEYGVGAMLAEEVANVEADLQHAREKFQAAASAVRQGTDWRAAIQFPIAEIADEARAADLIVTSLGRKKGGSDYNFAAPGALVLQTGRPVLAAPPGATTLNAAKVIVAWKDSRESRRAIHDALPFLQRATTVLLTEIVEGRESAVAAEARLADVGVHLLRHGVKTQPSVLVEEKGSSASRQLLDVAERQDADLIVAGGYGHTRFQEWVFGGFTRALLAQSDRAVLFSH